MKPTDHVLVWAESFENEDRRVEYSDIGDYIVSTVFLGLDHSFGGRPQWFETMVFGPEGSDDHDDHMRRYETEKEARAGHEEVILEVLEEIEGKEDGKG